ncbi:DoxX family membrane protein [bacterium]|nr:DoxX family membrane protein [bacterium]
MVRMVRIGLPHRRERCRAMKGDASGPRVSLLSLALRIVLGAMFLYAGIEKAVDPPGFAQSIANYVILPAWMVGPAAVVLPWIEIMAGLSLLAGVFLPGGAMIAAALMLIFSCALVFALARGLDISCGCFSTDPGKGTITWWYLVRDLTLFLMAVTLLFLSPGDRYSGDHLIRGLREKDGPGADSPS